MRDSAAPLTEGHLRDLAAAIAAAGGGVVLERSQPGLTDSEIDEATASLGLRLPPELRTWFGWRDGAARYAWTPANEWRSLADAIADNVVWRQVAAELLAEPDFGPEDVWRPH